MPSEPVQITWANEDDARKELREFEAIAAFLNGYLAGRSGQGTVRRGAA